MTGPRRRFEVVPPDWGQTHLSSDAVVAFVDDELRPAAHRRAADHVRVCPDCAAEVAVQRQARAALRSACIPALSSSLLLSLRAIPQDTELPGPPPGLAVSADGRLVQPLRESGPGPRLRLGVAATGLALGMIALTVALLPAEPEPGVFGGAVLGSGARLQVQAEPVAAQAHPRPSTEPRGSAEQATWPGTDAVMEQLDALPASFPVYH
jgi:anti-sigma factor RsiW